MGPIPQHLTVEDSPSQSIERDFFGGIMRLLVQEALNYGLLVDLKGPLCLNHIISSQLL